MYILCNSDTMAQIQPTKIITTIHQQKMNSQHFGAKQNFSYDNVTWKMLCMCVRERVRVNKREKAMKRNDRD